MINIPKQLYQIPLTTTCWTLPSMWLTITRTGYHWTTSKVYTFHWHVTTFYISYQWIPMSWCCLIYPIIQEKYLWLPHCKLPTGNRKKTATASVCLSAKLIILALFQAIIFTFFTSNPRPIGGHYESTILTNSVKKWGVEIRNCSASVHWYLDEHWTIQWA